VCFGGAAGGVSKDDSSVVEITYQFEYKPAEENVTVGDITVPSKYGWDVASACYSPTDGTNGISAKPYQVDVDRVMYAFNFSALGIGS
jgi:hypothetical protein